MSIEQEVANRVADRIRTRLSDIETGEEITEPGQAGELLLWGASVFDGYYNASDTNKSVLSEDGFSHTGDMFEIAGKGEEQRFYQFIGRCKDIIVRCGVKISSDKLDNLLASHPKIAKVAVVGYAHEVLEERVYPSSSCSSLSKSNDTVPGVSSSEHSLQTTMPRSGLPQLLCVSRSGEPRLPITHLSAH